MPAYGDAARATSGHARPDDVPAPARPNRAAPGTHRYRVTEPGLRLALFFTRVHACLFRPGLSVVMPNAARNNTPLCRAFAHLEHTMDQWWAEAKRAG